MVHLVVERLAEGILAASQGQLHKGLLEGRRQSVARLCPSGSIISPLPEGSHQGVHQPGKGGCVQAGSPVVLGPCSHSSYSLPRMRQVSSKEVWVAVCWNRLGACSCAVELATGWEDLPGACAHADCCAPGNNLLPGAHSQGFSPAASLSLQQ